MTSSANDKKACAYNEYCLEPVIGKVGNLPTCQSHRIMLVLRAEEQKTELKFYADKIAKREKWLEEAEQEEKQLVTKLNKLVDIAKKHRRRRQDPELAELGRQTERRLYELREEMDHIQSQITTLQGNSKHAEKRFATEENRSLKLDWRDGDGALGDD